MKRLYTLLFVILVVHYPIMVSVGSHVNSDPCPVPSPCRCEKNKIDCENVGLTELPTFNKVNVTYNGWTLYFSNNSISKISTKVFVNITITWLNLGHNCISSIADDAFHGSENTLDSLFLQYNRLNSLPTALGKLNKLSALTIHYNPIKTFNDDILRNLAKSLQFFILGSPEMIKWPVSIRYMKNLNFVTFYSLPMSNLPVDAFQGLEKVKMDMNFEFTNLVCIPKALRVLENLEALDFVNNSRLLSTGITKDSFKGMAYLKFLTMENCSLTEVPDISELPNLFVLEFTNCPISRWISDKRLNYSSLSRLNLDQTEISAVPSIVRELKNITSLSFMGSRITEITSNDFSGLVNLQFLTLSNSPVHDIAEDAFQDNKAIIVLNLNNLNLTGFPKAIKRIPKVQSLDLSNNTINCSCADMGWLKGWSGIKYTYVYGKCHNFKMDINEYLHNEVNKC